MTIGEIFVLLAYIIPTFILVVIWGIFVSNLKKKNENIDFYFFLIPAIFLIAIVSYYYMVINTTYRIALPNLW